MIEWRTDVLDPDSQRAEAVAAARRRLEQHWAAQRELRAEREATVLRLRQLCGLGAPAPKHWSWADRLRGGPPERPRTLRERLAGREGAHGR
jgi:hypothetical protein